MLWCAEDCVVLVFSKDNKSEIHLIPTNLPKLNVLRLRQFGAAFTELDGIRIITNKDTYLLRQLSEEYSAIHKKYGKPSPGKELFDAYNKFIAREPQKNDIRKET